MPNLRRVVFIYANDPEPILLERMMALENTGRYEPYAVYWHRCDSTLAIPWSSDIDDQRFIRIDMPDPRGGILRRALLTVRFALRVRKYLKHVDPHVQVAIYPDMLLALRIAMLGRKKVPTMYELWDVVGSARISRPERLLLKRLMGGLKSIFVTATAYESEYLRPNGLISESTQVLYASNSPANWKFRAQNLPDNHHDLTIAYIGQIRVASQLQNLISAVSTVCESGTHIKLLIAGGGEAKDWIEDLSKTVDFIDYRGPFDFHRDIEALYSEVDLMFALYPQSEFNFRVHWSRRAHQAILSGIPLIVARGSNMGDYIEHNNLGWAVSDDSQNDLEQLLYAITAQPTRLATLRTDLESVLSRHRFESFQDDMIESYDALFD